MTDEQLETMVLRRPRNRVELMRIKGIGPKKADDFGEAFLQVLQKGEQVLPAQAKEVQPSSEEEPFAKERYIFLDRVRNRLARRTNANAEDILSDEALHTLAQGREEDVSLAPELWRPEFAKALKNFQEMNK